MPRNISVPLTDAERAVVEQFRPILTAAHVKEQPVTVHYLKRDGSRGAATGPVTFFNGEESTASVTIDSTADKGRPTTINLRLVRKVLL